MNEEIEVYSISGGGILITLGHLSVELKKEDAKRVNVLLEIVDWIEEIMKLEKDVKEEFKDDILQLITEKKKELSSTEKNSAIRFMKGHYTWHTLRNIFEVAIRSDEDAAREIVNRYT